MQIKLSFSKEALRLPKRYEILERQVQQSGGEISRIVRKISTASEHIEKILGRISIGGTGQFQLVMGESGSGKTTFLRTLPHFFKEIHTHSFNEESTFTEILDEIKKTSHLEGYRIFIIDEKDNPVIIEYELRQFFEKLRVLFRKPEGQVLLLWPITDRESADLISKIAWEVGKESVAPLEGPIYEFTGLPKSEYFDVADDTIRNLNKGESLDSFGITKEISQRLLTNCNTIGEYYSLIESKAIEINEKTWKILEQKVKPKIWILLPGDSSTELERTVRSLTSGIESKVDIDRMCSYLDDQSNESAYLNDWRRRRSDAGFLFRYLDVRLFSISPNHALSAIRTFGSAAAKLTLKKQSESKTICFDQFKRSDFYLALTSQTNSSKRSVSKTTQDTQYEYIRMQQAAKSQDKLLNQGFSKALEETLTENGVENVQIKCEKQELNGTNLKPDIQLILSPSEVVCLELTWRSTGIEIPGEIAAKQNTLSTGHIQKYILEKVMEYVKELGI